MGQKAKGRCNKCGSTFTYRDGGGFTFVLLRCELCGRGHEIDVARNGSRHVEEPAAPCKCGGRITANAEIRCPFCKSTDITEGEILELYD